VENLVGRGTAILFDLDGTLVDSTHQIVAAANKARINFGISIRSREYYLERIGLPADFLFEDLRQNDQDVAVLVDKFRENLNEISCYPSNLYTGVVGLLDLLSKSDCPVLIATNKPASLAAKVLREVGVRDRFREVVGIDGLRPKPSPDIINRCLSLLNVSPSKAIMIGDRREDVQSATEAGVKAIGIAQGFHSEVDLLDSGAIATFPTINHLFESLVENLEDLQ
jgi:phosphoglycolate phosphatase